MPYDQKAVIYFDRRTENKVFLVDVRENQNPEYHDRAFACLHELYDMVETQFEFDAWRYDLTIKAGYYQVVYKEKKDGNSKTILRPESLSYENMDQEKFREVWLAIHQAFSKEYGDLLTWEQIQRWLAM